MPYCKKCGEELPEYAVFCTKCGLKYPVSGAPTEDHAAPSPQQTDVEQQPIVQNGSPEQQNPAPIQQGDTNTTGTQSPWFRNNSMALFIILGIVAYVLLQFSTVMVFKVYALGVLLGVFAILTAIAFCVIGIIRYVMSSKPAGKKHTTCDNVCFALSIIGVVYVLFMTLFVL